jgi:hypothetical protein
MRRAIALDVDIEDVPAIVALGVAAVGEGWAWAAKAPRTDIGKPLGVAAGRANTRADPLGQAGGNKKLTVLDQGIRDLLVVTYCGKPSLIRLQRRLFH